MERGEGGVTQRPHIAAGGCFSNDAGLLGLRKERVILGVICHPRMPKGLGLGWFASHALDRSRRPLPSDPKPA